MIQPSAPRLTLTISIDVDTSKPTRDAAGFPVASVVMRGDCSPGDECLRELALRSALYELQRIAVRGAAVIGSAAQACAPVEVKCLDGVVESWGRAK